MNCFIHVFSIMRYRLLPFVLMLTANKLVAQTMLLESSARKAWQPNQPVLAADYQASPSEQLRRYQKEIGFQTDTRVSLASVLDVPSKKRDRGPKLEKAYFAAIWLKDQSATLTTDTAELAKQRVYFDLAELAARRARRTLQQLQDSIRGYGTVYIYYVQVANEACAWYHKQSDAYSKTLYIDKNPVAYLEWRKMVQRALQEWAAFATPVEAAERLLHDQPVEPGYQKSETVLGKLGCK